MRNNLVFCAFCTTLILFSPACGSDTAAQKAASQPSEGGQAPAAGSMTGTVEGTGMTVRSAIFAAGTVNNLDLFILLLSDQPNACDLMTKNLRAKNSASLIAVLTNVSNSAATQPIVAGTYAMNDGSATAAGMTGLASFFAYDGTCVPRISAVDLSARLTAKATTASAPDSPGTITGGSTVLTAVSATAATGTFSYAVGPQADSIKGTFNATACPALLAQATSTAPKTCQ